MAEKLIFVVDDEDTIRKLMEHWVVKRWGYRAETFTAGEECLERLGEDPDLILLDVMLPGISGVDTLKEIKQRTPELPVIMLSAQGSIELALDTLKLGATDYFGKPIDFPKLEIAVKNAIQLHDVTREVHRLRDSAERRVHFDNIIAQSGEMQEVFHLVEKVKESDIPVLIMGESGTGKELIARAIHYNSKRKDGPFVVINCASIPKDLLESEFFGHEKGAFTGAIQRRIGRFEQGNGGTIFLDEIGELDLSLQAKLLRVIQSKQFERVGGNETITTDARLVSATNRELKLEVKERRFREDLYFRLATFPVLLPPLRQRKSDILLLAEHFLKEYAQEASKPGMRFSRKALKLMFDYPWPGNVRELENVVQRGVVIADGMAITETELPLSIQTFGAPATAGGISRDIFEDTGVIVPMDKLKEAAIRQALKITNGNIVEAASQLGIGRATFYRLMKKFKIEA